MPRGVYERESKEEVKEDVKQEARVEQAEPKEQTFVIKTENDAYIHSRLRSQPQTIDEIKVSDEKITTEATNILKLPPTIQKALDSRELSPRWVSKDKRQIDRALDIRGWVIFNRALFPHIPKHYFTSNGTVENGDLILCCMSTKRVERLRQIPGERSSEKLKDLPMNRWKQSSGAEKIGYYKPAYTAEPDGQTAVAGIVPDAPTENNE